MAHPGGRPPLYTDPAVLQADVDKYFETDEKPTLAGLAYSIGMSRESLYNYGEKEQFFDIIKRAREKVEALYEARLLYSTQPTGVIFALKNMNWSDKNEVTQTTKLELTTKLSTEKLAEIEKLLTE